MQFKFVKFGSFKSFEFSNKPVGDWFAHC